MKRFENATLEYNADKNELVFRDSRTNGIFFAIEFLANKEIKRIFSLYPLSVEVIEKSIELKFSIQDNEGKQSVLTLLIELAQLNSDRKSIINISNEEFDNIVFS